MLNGEVAAGQARAWSLLRKLGEGDAGEVYLVEALLDRKQAILKRPRRSAFTSDIIRQASQIAREASILDALGSLNKNNGAPRTPELLDQSKTGSEFSDRYFIVISIASGFDLSTLARLARYGRSSIETADALLNDGSSQFLDLVINSASLPTLLLLRVIHSLLEFLETIHTSAGDSPSGDYRGIIWNDIKPEHIFWDPALAQLTLIDWGNSQFLESDGSTKDRQFSRINDYSQFLETFGRFLLEEFALLHQSLEWPEGIPPSKAYSSGIAPLKRRVETLLQEENQALIKARHEEARLGKAQPATIETLDALQLAQQQITALGELPNSPLLINLLQTLAENLVNAEQYTEFVQLCHKAASIASQSKERWGLFALLADLTSSETIRPAALKAGLANEWDSAFWELRLAALSHPEPPWWGELSQKVRKLYLPVINSEAISPLVALNRLIHTLQIALQSSSVQSTVRPGLNMRNGEASDPARRYQFDSLYRSLKEEVLPRWTQMEPDPPDSGVEYSEIERLFGDILDLSPDAGATLVRSLDQARAQAQITMDAWNNQDFEIARRGLRRIMLWDPDRLRLLLADHAIQRAPAWLIQVRNGPNQDEPLQDFVTRLGLDGRELRHMVGAASWLDSILEAFSRLRKGAEPTQVMLSFPELRNELTWLLEMDPRRPLLLTLKPVKLERNPGGAALDPLIYGLRESSFGPGSEFILAEPLDVWAAEARGSSARVFLGYLRGSAAAPRQAAIKVMRPEKAEYALPLFKEEARILSLLRDVPGVTPLLECGFLRLDPGQDLPPDDDTSLAKGLSGKAHRFGPDGVHNFINDLDKRSGSGWLPYLALEKEDRSANLLLLCDIGYTRGRFMPILESLRLGIQICEILEAAHARNVVYRDHKILHYYWEETNNGVSMIDWNIAKRYPQGLSPEDIQFDLVQFGARAFHHIITGRVAPGALPLGPTRPDEIEAAAHSYSAQWTYDDQRLPREIKDILERLLSGGYGNARELRHDLHASFRQLSSLIPQE
jgi:serine/threonine protein kinase